LPLVKRRREWTKSSWEIFAPSSGMGGEGGRGSMGRVKENVRGNPRGLPIFLKERTEIEAIEKEGFAFLLKEEASIEAGGNIIFNLLRKTKPA